MNFQPLPALSTEARLLKLTDAAKERELATSFPYLKAIFDSTAHMLQTIQSIKENRDECVELARMAAALALSIERDLIDDPTAFRVQGYKLKPLSSLLEHIDKFITSFTALSRPERAMNERSVQQAITKFEGNLEAQASRFKISPESDLARWYFLHEKIDDSFGTHLWPDSGPRHTHIYDDGEVSNMITAAVSGGIRDLSSEVQIQGYVPAARGAICLIWSGMLSNNYPVAVKHLIQAHTDTTRKVFIREFLDEALLWSSAMHHENVLPLLGVARFQSTVALVSPWMDEGSLDTYVKNHPDTNVEVLFTDVARALAYLHSKGIVYGLLRTSTVLVSPAGRAYLSSFTHGAMQKGKFPSGTAPESDVFDFGTLITEILSKRVKPKSTTEPVPQQTSGGFLTTPDPPHSADGLEDDLWTIARSCETNKPADRPSMNEVARRMVYLCDARNPLSKQIGPSTSKPYPALKDISSEIKKLSEHPIAGGGHSDLYLGERRLGSAKTELVALKLVRFFGSMGPDINATRRRFQNEASLWAEFRHPRILEFYGICTHGPQAIFMVTPFLENGTILEYLSVNPDADRLCLLCQAAEGLLYLHSSEPPVVHGDMKASNILITDAGTAVLADFGLSKLSHELTTTMLQGAGSPRWMAPELVMLGDNVAGPIKTQKSDIYAYGHVILEVLSNKLPFFHLKEDVHVLVELIHSGRSPRPDGPVAYAWLNDSAWSLSRNCTAINLDERPGISSVLSQIYRLHEVRTFQQM